MSSSASVKPQTAEYAGFNVISLRLFNPENRLTLENLLTPVRNTNLM